MQETQDLYRLEVSWDFSFITVLLPSHGKVCDWKNVLGQQKYCLRLIIYHKLIASGEHLLFLPVEGELEVHLGDEAGIPNRCKKPRVHTLECNKIPGRKLNTPSSPIATWRLCGSLHYLANSLSKSPSATGACKLKLTVSTAGELTSNKCQICE